MLAHFPDSQCQWLTLEKGEVHLNSRRGFNTFRLDEMQYFVETIYDGYRLGLAPEAFEYVTGFFSDEVGFLDGHGASIDKGGIPWCEEAAARVREKLGFFEPRLLFEDGEYAPETRVHYWEGLTDTLAHSFYKTVNDWCLRWGKRFTAHLKGEENIFFQLPCSGSCLQNLRQVNTPAIDALERYPGNHYYPRLVSSLARQFGDGLCLCEALGGSGWGLTPHDLENYIDWLAGCGVNHFAFHLWQYDHTSASVRDWPPNIPWGMSWREALPAVLSRLRHRWDDHVRRPDTLLVSPVRGCMAAFDPRDAMVLNEHNGDGVPDTPAGRISTRFNALAELLHHSGLDFDVTEERLLEQHSTVRNGMLHLGQAAYRRLIIAEGCRWEAPACTVPFPVIHANELTWRFQTLTGPNQLPLSWDSAGVARVRCDVPLKNLRILLLDPVAGLCANGEPLSGHQTEEGWFFPIPDGLAADTPLTIAMTPLSQGEQQPFGFIQGDFLVKNDHPLQPRDVRQWLAEDAFRLAPWAGPIDCRDLISAGFPFCKSAAVVTALRYVDAQGMLHLGQVEADAARLLLPDQTALWVFGDDWQVQTALPEGFHPVTLELYPSTFNTYGPHHHHQGDRHLTSPDQYTGKKNFADAPDAPEYTLIPHWHLVRFGVC